MHLYTRTLFYLHKHLYTETLQHTLHTKTFTHRRFYTQHFYTDALVHTNTFTHKHLYTETLVHINLFACEKVTPAHEKSQFYLRFCRSTLISCERVAPAHEKSQFYLRFCYTEKALLHGNTFTHKHLYTETLLCERVAPGQVKSQFYLSFCRSTLISCERVDVSWLAAGTTLGLKRER